MILWINICLNHGFTLAWESFKLVLIFCFDLSDQMFDYYFLESKVPSCRILKLLCFFIKCIYIYSLIHDQKMAIIWMIMTVLYNCWWKYVFYVLVEICFGKMLCFGGILCFEVFHMFCVMIFSLYPCIQVLAWFGFFFHVPMFYIQVMKVRLWILTCISKSISASQKKYA